MLPDVPAGLLDESLLEKENYLIKVIEDSDSIQEATQILYRDEFYSGIMKEECGIISSMPVQQAREKIRSLLLSEKLAFPIFETSRKALTRSGSPVIVAIVKDQWFLDYSSPDLLICLLQPQQTGMNFIQVS